LKLFFSYLEGRKFTEILGVALNQFIVSSGVVKSVGLFVMAFLGFSQFWMPADYRLIVCLAFVYFLLGYWKDPKAY
jgi:hypothetical protein